MKKKSTTLKYDIICGTGQHRMYTACLAEIMMLMKYGNLPDYFWKRPEYYDEYVKLIKLAGKISKGIGRDRFAYFIYKNPKYNFNQDIGLLIYNLNLDKNYNPEFSLIELTKVLKNRFRPKKELVQDIPTTEVQEPKKNSTIRDFLGDI
jgi:hypothetical protein